ncbi:T3SS effector HopA1 family protein [Nonomuraea sp. NPDC050790]|uniref:T3SS effector HopA1 family protein n=1 Tax=Nonomuraea sp. NPDC050790 TaxID=3364371 RepID=UPI003787824D
MPAHTTRNRQNTNSRTRRRSLGTTTGADLRRPRGGGVTKPKTKRLTSVPAWTDAERQTLSSDADKRALRAVYNRFYQGQDRRLSMQDGVTMTKVYNFVAQADNGYLNRSVDKAAMRRLRADGGRVYSVEPQGGGDFEAELDSTGNYFRVENRNAARDDASLDGKARRIVVNVNNQDAALRIARNLTQLYTDPAVSRYFRQFKMYAAGQDQRGVSTKHDKVVIYYAMRDNNSPTDHVGDRIVEVLENSVGPDDLDDRLSPFYRRLAPGIGWSHEPARYLKSLKKDNPSFTEARSAVIANAMLANPQVKTAQEFYDLINNALRDAKVDPARPHRQGS